MNYNFASRVYCPKCKKSFLKNTVLATYLANEKVCYYCIKNSDKVDRRVKR